MLAKRGFLFFIHTPSVLQFFNNFLSFIYLFYVIYLFNIFLFNLNISLINKEDIRVAKRVTGLRSRSYHYQRY